ncbi:hypothetical protein V5O48_003373 [Marasmius crinis-equi]|uniref:Tubulin-specific chaperone D n=1 Tax=Marasmius crinis-equi TaxID=585013 RepID=A0ABR3FTC0_9AGAR
MDDELDELKQFTSFDKYHVFVKTQGDLLKADLYSEPSPEEEQAEVLQYQRLNLILQEYQEQSYLLDPFLEELVTPVLDRLRLHAKEFVSDQNLSPSSGRLWRIALLLYGYIKFRGYKAIVRFFPHEVSDLSIVVGYMQTSNDVVRQPKQWALRYVFLLWASLICMIPFDLAQFDEGETGQTARTIEQIAKEHLDKAGLEREGAAILLSRLYMRRDTSGQYDAFLDWSKTLLTDTLDPFIVTGTLQVLAETLKAGPPNVVKATIVAYWSLNAALESHESILTNTVVRKFKTKITSRVGLRLLPGRAASRRSRGRALAGENTSQSTQSNDDDIEVPEEEDAILEQLFGALQDRDTVVRWSAAKGVARISERLPSDFAEQVLETILGLFSIHSVAAASLYDVPPIAESTWHGACLSCAEIARRGLIPSDKLPELIRWLSKALYFDIRKGAHSIGSNVRDASAYVLWALARSQNLSDLVPHANELARHLVTVSLFDREVHIRRAASAAFQEFVGRTSLFPHGIDVLAKTDFYAVGIRRNSFLVAAPQVAEHEEYSPFLFDHLLNVTLRHWDASMRRLASQSLRLICLSNLPKFGPEGIVRATKLMDSADISDLHGSLLALAEIAKAYEAAEARNLEDEKRNIFERLRRIPEKTLLGARNDILLSAACGLIEATVTLSEINLGDKSSVPYWKNVLEHALKHRDIAVQEAAASAMGALMMVPEIVNSLVDALLDGLTDYSVDERGDVGSWVRIACLRGLNTFMELVLGTVRDLPAPEEYLPPAKFQRVVQGVLKQGVERLDNVRLEAGQAFRNILSVTSVSDYDRWKVVNQTFFGELFLEGDAKITGWNDAIWLFPRAVQILGTEAYRMPVLLGIISSIGSLTDSTHRPAATSLVSYVRSLPAHSTDIGQYDAVALGNDLYQHAKANLTSNAVMVPVLQVFNVLLEGDALGPLVASEEGVKMQTPVVLYPTVRANAAEFLYLALQRMDLGKQTDEAEDLLLETEWSTLSPDDARKAAMELINQLAR